MLSFCKTCRCAGETLHDQEEELQPLTSGKTAGRNLEELLSDLGLKDLFKTKLTVGRALEIGGRSVSEESALSLEALPRCVLNRLMMVNVAARSAKYTPSDHEAPAPGPDSDWGNLVKDPDNRNAINPLDVITAILLCSDNFLQHELVVKMSMCQFAVPLLLPHCDTQKCTLMLWAMRGVVKKFRPHSLAYPKASIENSIALTNLPMVSFIRLGEVSMSKSQILNKLLSNPQQYHDTFVHRDMECGDCPRRISDGLVEITWYLPCGNKNIDIFSEPMAVANFRGDVRSFETQYSFLCHTSAAIFVFFDNLKLDLKYWTIKNVKAQLFLIINSQGKTISSDMLQKVATDCNIERSNIIMKTKQNDADFVRKLSSTVREVIEKSPQKMSVKDMYDVALELGIQVDENCNECQRAKQRADELTCNIEDTLKFKKDQLPLQAEIWKELSQIEKESSRIRVVTVLGVQSTGKSTLLNTMFGVQFAVSSGRCTRGAFMLLIRVKEDFREQLGCDFLMVIDTEGLKSPELAQLTDSYEHDNELAALVVGLSDITIINIAMENSAEMKDILQIVVHAFLRMTEVGKKPCCQFVHQNVADVSAHDNNLRDRQLLLEQLDEMTQVAARMEKKGETMTFTDVMDYVPERNTWYIPGLWHGNPPMASVSAGYSEAVNEFKSRMIDTLKELKGTRPAHTIPELLGWTKSLWKAVKYENFIFSFQNSLVADAYTTLCTEFNKWEWDFRKHMYTWVSEAETSVLNFGTAALTAQKASSLDDLLSVLENEASHELAKGEKQITKSLTNYYQRKEGHVYLVEKYREDFMNSVKSLKRELQTALFMKLETAMNIKKGMASVEGIKKKHKTIMEDQVQKLVKVCRTSQTPISDQQLEQEFEKMWTETMKMLSFKGLKRLNIVQQVYSLLQSNLETKGGDNDPQQCLQKFKQQYCTDFRDLFHKRDLCHRKAQEFTRQCLEPAVRQYVSKALGPDIVDEMMTGNKAIDFSTRSFFQFSILKQLLAEDKFENFAGYITNYENFVKKWIVNWIVGAFSSTPNRIAVMEDYHLKKIIRNIKEAVMSAKVAVRSEEEISICQFICGTLSETLVIPKDALDAVMVLNHAKTEQFFDWLLSSIDEMEESLSIEFHRHKDVRTRLTTMPFKPQDELFNRVIGCGKQCPFCLAPCEAGGKGHTEHFTSIHRPEGLRRYRWKRTRKLVPEICSSLVASEITFRSAETNGKFHPYKDYQKFYPDWRIQPDTSIQASAYWKYVFAKFNTQFAKEYDAEPADLPPNWKSITKEQAMKSLEEAFMMKKRKNW
ncbi:hypothetical protein MATL_G00208540 [Megalops atlanticus]|uniref:VLIG-type G domain-containing protein n=1 Tax=Megalops atlanticus TaxID=7932 RepID=A0A9D3T4N4_MEGAT|nr:hypothetical protein MATL_G00208540 [Megalops atlanticus]